MSIKDDILEKGEPVLGLVGDGLDIIDGLTATKVDDTAVAVLAGVRAALAVIKAGASGSMTPDECDEAFDDFRLRLGFDRAAADAAIDKKFPEGEP